MKANKQLNRTNETMAAYTFLFGCFCQGRPNPMENLESGASTITDINGNAFFLPSMASNEISTAGCYRLINNLSSEHALETQQRMAKYWVQQTTSWHSEYWYGEYSRSAVQGTEIIDKKCWVQYIYTLWGIYHKTCCVTRMGRGKKEGRRGGAG